ncbi:MAG: lysozyme [Paludibacteraceae bacterium]|nr:lysozyme [Paludibacteraceae bacterium]
MRKAVTNYIPLLTALSLSLIGLGGAVLAVANKRRNDMTIGIDGINLIKHFEGCRLESYQDSVGVWTIGYGHTQGVFAGQRITQADAEALLRQDLANFSKSVSNIVPSNVSQNQFDALVSFAYNLGVKNLKTSTLLKKVKDNPNDPTIADEFGRWVYAGGKKLTGLVRRRESEAKLYSTGELIYG